MPTQVDQPQMQKNGGGHLLGRDHQRYACPEPLEYADDQAHPKHSVRSKESLCSVRGHRCVAQIDLALALDFFPDLAQFE